MTRKRIALLAIAVLAAGLAVGTARGAPRAWEFGDSSFIVETRPPFDPRGILELLYDNRPDSALALTRRYQKASPKDPYPLLLEAKLLRDRVNDEDNNKELIRRSTSPIHDVLDSAIALSDEALERDVNDYEQYYFRGFSWLSKAQLYVLTKNWWSAARASSHGKADLERFLEKYPDDPDAQGALGAYLYFADTLPGFVKFLARLILLPGGDRERGLAMMQYASSHDGVFSTDWRFVLAAIDLVFEGNFEKGTDGLVSLLEEYPYYTRLAEAVAVVETLYPGRTRELFKIVDTAIGNHIGLGEEYVDWNLIKRLQLVQTFTEGYFGRPMEAVGHYTALIAAPPLHPDWVVPIALLNRGFLQQKMGETDEARKAFDSVRKNETWTVYHPAADAMFASTRRPMKTIDAADLDFVQLLYDGEFEGASRLLERYKATRGEDALYEFYSGDLEALTGNFTPAKEIYERALSCDARGGEQIYQMYSAMRLAELAGSAGRYSEARGLLKRAARYCHANYLLDFLIESRQRYYELIDEGKLDAKPGLFVRRRASEP
jgi:tetratricopeptide (TPR) repeat protein